MCALTAATKAPILARDATLLFEDQFGGGNIDGAKWTPTDTESKITVSGGPLRFAGGKATPGWADPAIVSKAPWGPWARQAGLTVTWQITPGATNKELLVGFTDGSLATNAAEAHGLYLKDTGVISVIVNAATGIVTPAAYTAVATWGQIQCIRQADGSLKGAKYSISTVSKNGPWTPIWIDASVTTTPLYVFAESYNAAFTAQDVEVQQLSPVPPVISVTPSAPPMASGNEMVTNTGLEGTYVGGVAPNWSKLGTPTVAESATVHGGSSAQSITDTNSFSHCVYQNLTWVLGTWYRLTLWHRRVSGGASPRINHSTLNGLPDGTFTPSDGAYAQATYVFRSPASTTNALQLSISAAGGTVMLYDDVSEVPLAFSTASLLTWLGTHNSHNGVFGVPVTPSAGYHAGVVCHADSATAPQNSLLAYYDRTAGKAYLLKQVAGVWTELKSATIAYAAGAVCEIVSNGTSHAGYYGKTIIDSVQSSLDVSGWGTNMFYFGTLAGDAPGVAEAYV